MNRGIVLAAVWTLCFPVFFSCAPEQEGKNPVKAVISTNISNLDVTAFAEDRFGHIWIGTLSGLNKYDSHEFTQYFWDSSEESVSSSHISSLFTDSEGRLWVGTVDGVSIFTEQGKFVRVPIQHGNKFMTHIFEGPSGSLIFANTSAISEYDSETGTILLRVDGLSGIDLAFYDTDGFLWSVTDESLSRYDRDFREVESVPIGAQVNSATYSEDCSEVWISTDKGLLIYDTRGHRVVSVPAVISSDKYLSGGDIKLLRFINERQVVFSTYHNGICLYDKADGSLIRQGDWNFPFEAPDFPVSVIYTDSQGNIWFGSSEQGFKVCSGRKDMFSKRSSLRSFFQGRSVISISNENDRRVWICTSASDIYVYDIESEDISKVQLPAELRTDVGKPINCSSVMADRDGYVWLAFKENDKVVKCRNSRERLAVLGELEVKSPNVLYHDDAGRIWIGTGGTEILCCDSASCKVSETLNFFNDSRYYCFTTVFAPYLDGKILAGAFFRSLRTIDTETFRSDTLAISESSYWESITHSVIYPTDAVTYPDGTIYVGTLMNGLYKYKDGMPRLESVPGLPASDVCAIEKDLRGNIWVSTLDGLCNIYNGSGESVTYHDSDGTGGNQFNIQSSCILPDGLILFGGTHGITVVDPNFYPEMIKLPVVFENLTVHNELVYPGEDSPIESLLPYGPDITIKHNDNGFRISFAALNYNQRNRPRYSYILEGFNNYWVDGGRVNSAYFANLPAGKYRFRVKLNNSGSSFIDAENSILINVKPAPFASVPAIILYSLLLLSLSVFIAVSRRRLYMENMAKKAAQEEIARVQSINKQKSDFFAGVAHEFRSPLTMIAGPVATLSEKETVSGEDRRLLNLIKRNVNWMLRLVEQIMDFDRVEAIALKTGPVDLCHIIGETCNLFKSNARIKNIALKTSLMEDRMYVWADQDKVFKILVNLLSNSMKFTPSGGQIDISARICSGSEIAPEARRRLRPAGNFVELSVLDTGVGLKGVDTEKLFEKFSRLDNQTEDSMNMGSGIGLYFSMQLAKAHYGTIVAKDREDVPGSVFTLYFPSDESAYTEDEKTEAPSEIKPMAVQEYQDPSEDSGKPVIVIVDDDAEIVEYMRLILSGRYDIKAFFDAKSALDGLDTIPADIIISDIMMPGESGLSLCRKLKSSLQYSHIPVMLLTAKTSVEDQVYGLDAGADAYVAKPFDPKYLVALVNSLLENRQRMRSVLNKSVNTSDLPGQSLSVKDNNFMRDVNEIMESELSNPDLDIARMAEKLRISRTKLYYKLKGLTGENPGSFFRNYKLNVAARLLLEGKHNISEIAEMTGWGSVSQFSRAFKAHFGQSPSDYEG